MLKEIGMSLQQLCNHLFKYFVSLLCYIVESCNIVNSIFKTIELCSSEFCVCVCDSVWVVNDDNLSTKHVF